MVYSYKMETPNKKFKMSAKVTKKAAAALIQYKQQMQPSKTRVKQPEEPPSVVGPKILPVGDMV